MTHAEEASNRDGRWMHDNYGPVIWGGTGERWDLLQRYELPFAWDASHRRLHIGGIDVSPTFRKDGVQAELGWPLFEMSLQSS